MTFNFKKAIKNETYFDNQLTKFLLRRAFESQRLGFNLYWNLKYAIYLSYKKKSKLIR